MTGRREPLPAGVPERAYLTGLRDRLVAGLAPDLVGVYLMGSAALGAYAPGVSDLDVWAVASGPVAPGARRALVARVDHAALPCPARGLELVVACFAGPRPVVQVNLNDGPAVDRRAATSASRMPAAHWFTLDAAIGRDRAVALAGPPAGAAFPSIPRSAQLAAVSRSLAWHRRHEPGSPDAVLNALRGARYALEGVWGSKGAAVEWAAAARPGWAAEALRALEVRSRGGARMS